MQQFHIAVTRGTLNESEHPVSAVVTDAHGAVVAAAGDPDMITYWRSAAKPFQLMPLVEAGGIEKFGIDDEMLALACASHNAESVHREVGARWLRALGIAETDLACGGHASLWPALADAMIHDDVQPTPLWSNCSGKHAGLIGLARIKQWGITGYEEREHPVQGLVASTVAKWTGVPEPELRWGVDGCTAAAVALPLVGMARAYAGLATSDHSAARVIRTAMMNHPYMVAGADRLDTAVMQGWPDRVIAKIGAEGVYSAALPTLGLGVALKVHDGDMKSAMVALVRVLDEVVSRHGGSVEWPDSVLDHWRRPPVRNTRGAVTGHVEPQGGLTWR